MSLTVVPSRKWLWDWATPFLSLYFGLRPTIQCGAQNPSVRFSPTLSHVYISQQTAHLLWCLYFNDNRFFLSNPPPNTPPPPLLSPSSGCGSGWERKKKTFMLIGFDNTQHSRTEGSPIAKCNQRVESIILCPRGRRGWWGMCFWRCAEGRRVGMRGAVGRAPTGGPRLRRLEPSSPSILISSDLPLPCFSTLPSVLIWPAPRRAAGAAKARFHLQLSDARPCLCDSKPDRKMQQLEYTGSVSILSCCHKRPFKHAV